MVHKILYCFFVFSLFFASPGKAQETVDAKCCDSDTLAYLGVIDLLSSHIFADQAKIETLCSKKIRTHALCSDLICTDTLITKNSTFENLTTDLIITTTLNTETANIAHLLSDLTITNSLYAENMHLKTLLADLITTNSLSALYGEIKNLITENIETEKLKADIAQLELILTSTIFANFVDAEKAYIEDLTADTITTGTLHVDYFDIKNISFDTLIATTLKSDNYITNLRAMAANRNNVDNYNLGTDINFDTVVDDDNGDITQNPTMYHAPRSGYYAITVSVKTINVNISTPGHSDSPMGEHLDIFVNGTYQAQLYKEFNKKRNNAWTKRALLTSLLHLNKDDLVTFRYFAVHENPGNGEDDDVPGTATLIGSPLDNATWMIVHYVSTD